MTHLLSFFLPSLLFTASLAAEMTETYNPVFISSPDAERVARKIWVNECAGTIQGLTSWNEGEEFPSLGIGHFIWYRNDQVSPFREMFPDLLAFFALRDVQIPIWLSEDKTCPWHSREVFLSQQNSSQMIELRELLASTITLQAEFMGLRLQKSLPLMVSKFPEDKRNQMIRTFNLLIKEPQGLYAILDYLNFKGEGLLPNEAYRDEGWGLIQVLEMMQEPKDNETLIHSFAASANAVLERRVANSPIERNEKRWMKGWQNRIATYLRP